MKPTALLLLVLAAACERPGTATVDFRHQGPAGGRPAATFGREAITVEELEQRFDALSPLVRARYVTPEQRREYVEGLVRFELLAQEALRRGLANDPEVVEATKRVMVQTLLKKELEDKAITVSDAQVQEYYAAHQDNYVKPELTRAAQIVFKPADRAAAEAVLKQALALAPLDYAAFAKLVREHSQDERTRAIEGDLRFLADDVLSKEVGPAGLAALKSLTQVGAVVPTLVESPQGLHVLKLQGRQVAINLQVPEVKTSIVNILQNELRQSKYRGLLDSLRAQSGFKVDDAALASVKVDPKADAKSATLPQGGFVPPPDPVPEIR